MATETVPAKFTLFDLCDRCGATAKLRAFFVEEELLFCGHHGRDYLEALRKVAIRIEDDGTLLPARELAGSSI